MPGPILVHGLDDALTALAAAAALNLPVTLASAPGAAGHAGPAWFGELIAAAQAEYPAVALTAVLDCADAPGHVLAAVRWAAMPGRLRPVLRYTGDPGVERALGEIAAAAGLRLIRELEVALDLRRVSDPGEACRAWLLGVAAPPHLGYVSGQLNKDPNP